MRKNERLLLILVPLFMLLVACGFVREVWNIAGPQAPADVIGTQVFPDTTLIVPYLSPTPYPPYQEPVSPVDMSNCIPAAETYTWMLENFQQSSGTGGVTCRANYVFTNISRDTLHLAVLTAWDNNAMRDSKWEITDVEPGGRWEHKVSRTNYTDGTLTFNSVRKILMFLDTPECKSFRFEENEPIWEQLALTIEEFTCQ